jgi:glutathione S-transferase
MLEWMVLFLPALWLFAAYIGDLWAAMLGAGWTLARLGFIFAYAAEASRRVPFFLAQLLCFACLWGGALFGVIRSLI